MTFFARSRWYLVLLSSLSILILVAIAASRAFENSIMLFERTAFSAIASEHELPFLIYSDDQSRLEKLQASAVAEFEVDVFLTWDAAGEPIAVYSRTAGNTQQYPRLPALRQDSPIAEPGTAMVGSGGDLRGLSLWSALLDPGSVVYITLPVFSSLDPTQDDWAVDDFVGARIAPENGNSSRFVVGYAGLGASVTHWSTAALVSAWPFALVLLIPMLGLIGFSESLRRRITRPMEELQEFSRQVGTDGSAQKLRMEFSGELRDVFDAINQLVNRLRRREQEIESGQKQLSRKADESASRLSLREEELKQAAEQITEAKDRLHRAAYYDALTALPNRALFHEQLRQLLSVRERDGRYLALLLVNLNNFRRINESLGYTVGDQLLALVAQRLIGCVRASDMLTTNRQSATSIDVSRIGGDEFSLVLPMQDSPESAGEVAQRALRALAEPCSVEGHEIALTASIGISIAPSDGDNAEELLRAAAAALHHGKGGLNNEVIYYRQDMDTSAVDQFKFEIELRRALDREQLVLHYQPQVDTFDGAIVGAEALLRWQHPEFGLVSPDRFIPIAEELGMMRELGDWVLLEACRQMRDCSAQGLELPRVAVNVSAMEVSGDFVQRVWSALEKHGLRPSSLELGLSEGVLDDANPELARSVTALGDMGVYLSLDNFGTAGAPLACLGRYSLNEIKIDRRFVSGCDAPGDNGRLAKAIIAMAESLQMRPLAEGVETPGEYRFLAANGVRTMQGYLFSKPVSGEELQALLGVPWYYASQIQRMALSN